MLHSHINDRLPPGTLRENDGGRRLDQHAIEFKSQQQQDSKEAQQHVMLTYISSKA